MGAYSLCSWRSQSAIARLRAQLARRVTNVHSVDFVAKAGSSAVPATGERVNALPTVIAKILYGGMAQLRPDGIWDGD